MWKPLFFLCVVISFSAAAQPAITITQTVADYIVRNTPFQYQFELYRPSHQLTTLQSVNFSQTYGLQHNAGALAYTQLLAPNAETILLDFSYSGTIQLILNGKIIYNGQQFEKKAGAVFLERTIQLDKQLPLALKKGINHFCIVSKGGKAKAWEFLMQSGNPSVEISLNNVPGLGESVKQVTNFLVLGPIPAKSTETLDETITGAGIQPNQTYVINHQTCTWDIPRLSLSPYVLNPQPYWGSYYNYNYHTAGVAWAMAQLGYVTGKQQYAGFAHQYCNFILRHQPIIQRNVKSLWQTNSTDYFMANTPLLDFTAATAMPFIVQLISENNFEQQEGYEKFVSGIQAYVFNEQIRTVQGNFTRTTPIPFTTWVDDMFMGLPFVVHSATREKDSTQRAAMINDAVTQVKAFCGLLMDTTDSLFHHARHSTQPAIQYPYWLRANGWGIWAITEVLKAMPANHRAYPEILGIYQSFIRSAVRFQDAGGMWHNIINNPSTRVETSGTAILTLAIARGINEGWIARETYYPMAVKGWNALCKNILPDGQVKDIIVGCFTSEDVQYYEKQPLVMNDSHGMFCVLMCGLEMARLEKINH